MGARSTKIILDKNQNLSLCIGNPPLNMAHKTGIIVNLGASRTIADLRMLCGLDQGPILSTCALPDPPGAYLLITLQHSEQALMAIDDAALVLLAKVGDVVSGAMAREKDAGRQAQLFALFAGLRHAARHLAFAISLHDLLRRETSRHVVLVGAASATREVAGWLDTTGGWTVECRSGEPAAQHNLRERAYRLVADNPVFAALASLALTVRHRLQHPAHRDAPQKAKLLVEASARMESYLKPFLKTRSSAFVLTQRRHMPMHVNPLYRIDPAVNIRFLDHIALRPRHLLNWLQLRRSVSSSRLRALADDILNQCAPNDVNAPLLAALMARNGGISLWSWLAAEDLIREAAPSKVVLHNDNDLFERAILARARQASIPAICIQHGAFTEPMNLDGFEADEYLVWGKASEELLRRFGRTRPKISVVGHPGYAEIAAHATVRSAPTANPKILYATRSNSSETASYYPGREADFLNLILQAWPGPHAEISIKPHPRANPLSWYRGMAREFSATTGATASVTNRPLLESISLADYVICTGGTTVLEAVALNRTCIFILPPGREDVMGWSRFSCLHTLRFGDADTLRSLLGNPSHAWIDFSQPTIAAERQRFLNYFIGLETMLPPEKIMARLLQN